jgi:hypothetical protein
MRSGITVICFASFITLAGLDAEATLTKLPSPPAVSLIPCSSVGQVLASDFFTQTFRLKREDDGEIETLPFSKWTGFFRVVIGSKAGRPQEIDPTEIRSGDRICVVLDPSEATSMLIIVLEPARGSVGMALKMPVKANAESVDRSTECR